MQAGLCGCAEFLIYAQTPSRVLKSSVFGRL
jgi:hypothetical protein